MWKMLSALGLWQKNTSIIIATKAGRGGGPGGELDTAKEAEQSIIFDLG